MVNKQKVLIVDDDDNIAEPDFPISHQGVF